MQVDEEKSIYFSDADRIILLNGTVSKSDYLTTADLNKQTHTKKNTRFQVPFKPADSSLRTFMCVWYTFKCLLISKPFQSVVKCIFYHKIPSYCVNHMRACHSVRPSQTVFKCFLISKLYSASATRVLQQAKSLQVELKQAPFGFNSPHRLPFTWW